PGRPVTATVTVTDAAGQPAARVPVAILNYPPNFGPVRTFEGETDDAGQLKWTFPPGGDDGDGKIEAVVARSTRTHTVDYSVRGYSRLSLLTVKYDVPPNGFALVNVLVFGDGVSLPDIPVDLRVNDLTALTPDAASYVSADNVVTSARGAQFTFLAGSASGP